MLRTLLLIYVIGAIASFVAIVLWMKISCREDEDENRQYYYEYHGWDECENAFEKDILNVLIFIIGIAGAVIWPGIPIVLLGLYIYGRVEKKFPGITHMADKKEDFDDD